MELHFVIYATCPEPTPETPLLGYPPSLGSAERIITQAGFDPTDGYRVGRLNNDWNGHPKGAVIVFKNVNLADSFAVSREGADAVTQ